MLRAAIIFFVLALVAMALGESGIAGLSVEIGRTILSVFLFLAVISFIMALVSNQKRTIRSYVWLLLPVAFMLASGCAWTNKEMSAAESAPSARAQGAAEQTGASDVVQISFDKGSSALTEASRETLKNMIESAKSRGNINDVKVLAWSDAAYPSKEGEHLSKTDRELAKRRAESVRSYVKSELAVRKVDTYNMAARPNVLQKLFDTSDEQVKKAFEEAGVTSSNGRSVIEQASRALVMASVKE